MWTNKLSREEKIKILDDRREIRDVIFLWYYPEHWKSYDLIQCPFCDEVLRMYRWSGQKTCDRCGSVNTKFWHSRRPKTELIETTLETTSS